MPKWPEQQQNSRTLSGKTDRIYEIEYASAIFSGNDMLKMWQTHIIILAVLGKRGDDVS